MCWKWICNGFHFHLINSLLVLNQNSGQSSDRLSEHWFSHWLSHWPLRCNAITYWMARERQKICLTYQKYGHTCLQNGCQHDLNDSKYHLLKSIQSIITMHSMKVINCRANGGLTGLRKFSNAKQCYDVRGPDCGSCCQHGCGHAVFKTMFDSSAKSSRKFIITISYCNEEKLSSN